MAFSARFDGSEDPDRDAFPDSSPIGEQDFRLIELLAEKLADTARRQDDEGVLAILAELREFGWRP